MIRITPKGKAVAESLSLVKNSEEAIIAYLYEQGDTEPEEIFGELHIDDAKGLRVLGRLVNKGYISEEA